MFTIKQVFSFGMNKGKFDTYGNPVPTVTLVAVVENHSLSPCSKLSLSILLRLTGHTPKVR